MKKLILMTLLVQLFASCDTLNSRIFDGSSKTKDGASAGGGGGVGGGGDIPIDDPTNRCQHPKAFNYNANYHSDSPGPCIFYACKDVYYAEAHILAEFYKYVDQYGGEIVHFQSLCKNQDPGPDNCQHPDAKNFLKPGACLFEACNNPDYSEYADYLRFMNYVNEQGKGEVVAKNSLCKTQKVVSGCKDPKALNRDNKVDADNGTCKYAFCSDPMYKEFQEPQNNAILVHAKKYAELWGHSIEFVQGINTCKTPVDPEQTCEDQRAVNFGKKELCVFEACNKKNYEEYDFYLKITAYLAQNPGKGKLVVNNLLCKKKIVDQGCKESTATNYNQDPKITKDNGSCRWDLCLNNKFKEFSDSANQLLIQIVGNYAKAHGKDAYDFVRKSTCKTPIDTNDRRGCMNSYADNYDNKAKIEDKSCKFSVCLDCRYKEHKTEENQNKIKAMNKYAAENDLEVHQLISRSTCGDLNDQKGCMIPVAINYDRYATVESGKCKFKACINCKAHQYPEYDQELKDIIYDYYHWLKAQGKKHPKVVVYNTCKHKKYLIRTMFNDKCLLKSQSAVVRLRVNGKIVMENILTSAQREAKGVHVKKGDEYTLEIVNEGQDTGQYSIDNQGPSINGTVEGHVKHKVYCSKLD